MQTIYWSLSELLSSTGTQKCSRLAYIGRKDKRRYDYEKYSLSGFDNVNIDQFTEIERNHKWRLSKRRVRKGMGKYFYSSRVMDEQTNHDPCNFTHDFHGTTCNM